MPFNRTLCRYLHPLFTPYNMISLIDFSLIEDLLYSLPLNLM